MSNNIFYGSKKLPKEAADYIKNHINPNKYLNIEIYIYFLNNVVKIIKINLRARDKEITF